MLSPDVNVLLNAFRVDAERHEEYRAWLIAAGEGPEPLGIAELALSSFIRIATHPAMSRGHTPKEPVLAFVSALRAAPAFVPINPGPGHWAIFERYLALPEVYAGTVADAYLAAIAVEHLCTWVTADRGFGRFPGLDWRHPFAD